MWSASFVPSEDASPRTLTPPPPRPGTADSSYTLREKEGAPVSQTLIIEGTISANELASLLMTHGHRCRVVDPLAYLSQPRPNIDQSRKHSNHSTTIAAMSSNLTELLALEDMVEQQRERLRDMEDMLEQQREQLSDMELAKSKAIESANNCEKQSKASYDSYVIAQKKFDKQLGEQKKLLLEVNSCSLARLNQLLDDDKNTTYTLSLTHPSSISTHNS